MQIEQARLLVTVLQNAIGEAAHKGETEVNLQPQLVQLAEDARSDLQAAIAAATPAG